ncbi:MAG: KH domain-containing protein [Candidatus Binatia bacterium]
MYGLVDFLARNLVMNPESVEVKQNVTDDLSNFELRVHKDDLGRVIGKQGRTAKSLRTILNAAASRSQQKASLEIIEE